MEGGLRSLPPLAKSSADRRRGYAISYVVENLAKRDVAAQFRQIAQLTQLVLLLGIGLLRRGHRLTAEHTLVKRLTGVTT